MAPKSDLLDHYKLDADQIGDSVIHYSYRSDRARGLRKVKVEERWDNVRPIGHGSFGEVWQQKQSDSNEQRAIKVLRKHQMKSWGIDYEREIEALATFDKAQFRQEEVVVQFLGWWESEHSVHLAMEYFEMGDLSIFISEAKTSEQDARDIAGDLLQALVMIHSQGFTHRDLKPQNIFVVQTSPKYWVKLGDFGISKRLLNQSTALRTEVGTRAFSAPETTPDDYDETFQYTNAVDMWSLGCVIYNVLAHSLPYKTSHAKSLPFPIQPLKDRVHDQGINLLQCLLSVDPSTRWTAQKAVKHPWLEASSKASTVAAEDATGNASSVAQIERPNESQDGRNCPDDEVDMATSMPSMELIYTKLAERTESPINQLASQSSGHRGEDGQTDSSSNNDGRRKTMSFTYGISDSFVDPGIETFEPRRVGYHRPNYASRGLHESDTINKPTASPVMTTTVSIPPKIGIETSCSSLYDADEGATQTEPLMKAGHDALAVQRLQKPEEQAPEQMELITTLGDLCGEHGLMEQNKIARALELIREGVDLETRSRGETALHLAVRICHSDEGGHLTQILHELLERGADVDARNERGETALHTAVSFHRLTELVMGELARVPLEHRPNVNTLAPFLWTSLRFTPFHYAIASDGILFPDELLEKDADVDASKKRGDAALHFCLRNHNENGIEVVRQLLRYKANVNAKNHSLYTPLHYAVSLSCEEYVDVLLAAGARVNEIANNGRMALHWAVYNENQGQVMTRKLILAGINMNVIDMWGMTALDIARNEKKSGVIEAIEEAQKEGRRSHKDGNKAHS